MKNLAELSLKNKGLVWYFIIVVFVVIFVVDVDSVFGCLILIDKGVVFLIGNSESVEEVFK